MSNHLWSNGFFCTKKQKTDSEESVIHMMMGMARKFVNRKSVIRTWMLRTIAVLIAGYGVYAFARRGIGRYMLMLDHFVFFDFDEPIIFFIADYVAVMGLFVFVGHYISDGINHGIQRRY